MKISFQFLSIVALVLILLPSCEDVLDVEKDFSFSHQVMIDSDDNGYFSSDLVNFAEEVSVIDEYGDKIKKIDISKVSLSVRNHNGPQDQEIQSASIEVANEDGSEAILISSIENQVLSALEDDAVELDLNAEGIEKLNRLIRQKPHTLRIVLNGQLNEGMADFTAVFDFEGRMTANPL